MENSLLPLLRTALWGKSNSDEIKISPALMQTLQKQCLETVVSEILIQQAHSERLKSYLLQKVVATMKQHEKVNQVLLHLCKSYKNQGFSPILLKGQGCANYYPNPLLRPTGDLDIYIGGSLILPNDINVEKQHLSKKHLAFTYQGTDVEIHKYVETLLYPWYDKHFQQLTKAYLVNPRTIQLDGITFQIPPIQFQALMVFNHLWHHFIGGGIGLRQFVDLAYILHTDHNKIDKQILKADLKAIGLFKAWQIVGCVIVDALGLPEAEYPYYNNRYKKKGKALLRLAIKEGNLGNIHNWGNKNTPILKKKSTALRIKLKRCLWISSVSKTESFNYLLFILSNH